MFFAVVKTKVNSRVQTASDQMGRKGIGVSSDTSAFMLSTNKDRETCMKLTERVMIGQLEVNALSIQRGFESLDNKALPHSSMFKQITSKSK